MAKYHLEKKRNRLNQTKDGLWYAAPAPRQKLSTGDLCRYAVRNTTLNPAEVRAVLDLINEFVPRYLAEGYVIRLGELGSLSLAYGSEGVAQPEDFHPRLMRGASWPTACHIAAWPTTAADRRGRRGRASECFRAESLVMSPIFPIFAP